MNQPPDTGAYRTPEVWRLYERGRAVGFAKRFGSDFMWSQTGAAYSGREIPHAVQVRGLPLRTLRGEPIFHGDVISPPSDASDRYLVLGVGEDIFFAKPNSARLISREGSGFAQRRDFIRHANVLESPRISRTFDAALRAYAAREFPSGPMAWSLSLLIWAGCVAAAALQLGARGGVGPILSCVGGIAVGWSYFAAWKRISPETFRRSATSRVAEGAVWRTSLLFSGTWGLAVSLGLTGVTPSIGTVVAGMVASGLFGLGLAMVSGVLAADSLTRHQDRKLGIPSELRSFLETPSGFLRVSGASTPST